MLSGGSDLIANQGSESPGRWLHLSYGRVGLTASKYQRTQIRCQHQISLSTSFSCGYTAQALHRFSTAP